MSMSLLCIAQCALFEAGYANASRHLPCLFLARGTPKQMLAGCQVLHGKAPAAGQFFGI